MSSEQSGSVLLRKTRAGRVLQQTRSMSPLKALRLTLAKLAEDRMDLALAAMSVTERALRNDQLDGAFETDHLLLLLDHTDGRVGLATLDRTLVTVLTQQQTTGQLNKPDAPSERALTGIDAGLAAPFIERLIRQAADQLEDAEEQRLLAGYRFGIWAPTARQALIGLEAAEFRQMSMTVDVAAGLCQGAISLLMPVPPPPRRSPPPDETRAGDSETCAAPRTGPQLAESAMRVHADLRVALAQIEVPLSELTGMQAGSVLDLGTDTMDSAMVQDMTGRMISRGVLGQLNGTRALQLEHMPKPHIHPRRRASDRAELDLPDVTADTAPPQTQNLVQMSAAVPVSKDVMAGDLPDMSDLEGLDDAADGAQTASPSAAQLRKEA
ncbi:FliM/FliN family flagellar motor switch protein [Sulfitobacter sp. S190]|uniref:FliM/FliN family flagellar motor switch protein n=1 Tax=Sulfitobacter sp. S190 TaxID=2867022 RepID=UPI0021A37C43|nr:FliM/FliN family flagellar motor C-terminal domain-containing protein [Sulfitobacter sp. S190]UWR21072.1 FliM/FliN family flagellar motor switch protein [Sulfitobacter sp. S190]